MIRKISVLLFTILAVAAIHLYIFKHKPQDANSEDIVNSENIADNYINIIEEAYRNKNYEKVKQYSDSLFNKTDPADYEVKRTAISYNYKAEIELQKRSYDFYENEIERMQSIRDNMLTHFTLHKDTLYQDVGYYTIKSQSPDSENPNRCYLGAQVDEHGTASFTSYYHGAAINHKSVKVSIGDNYAQCDTALTSYTDVHLGLSTEKVTFTYNRDEGVMDFIANFEGPFTVKLIGDRTHTYTLKKEDSDAFSKVIALSKIIKEIENYKKMRNDTNRHIEYLTKRLSEIDRL